MSENISELFDAQIVGTPDPVCKLYWSADTPLETNCFLTNAQFTKTYEFDGLPVSAALALSYYYNEFGYVASVMLVANETKAAFCVQLTAMLDENGKPVSTKRLQELSERSRQVKQKFLDKVCQSYQWCLVKPATLFDPPTYRDCVDFLKKHIVELLARLKPQSDPSPTELLRALLQTDTNS